MEKKLLVYPALPTIIHQPITLVKHITLNEEKRWGISHTLPLYSSPLPSPAWYSSNLPIVPIPPIVHISTILYTVVSPVSQPGRQQNQALFAQHHHPPQSQPDPPSSLRPIYMDFVCRRHPMYLISRKLFAPLSNRIRSTQPELLLPLSYPQRVGERVTHQPIHPLTPLAQKNCISSPPVSSPPLGFSEFRSSPIFTLVLLCSASGV